MFPEVKAVSLFSFLLSFFLRMKECYKGETFLNCKKVDVLNFQWETNRRNVYLRNV